MPMNSGKSGIWTVTSLDCNLSKATMANNFTWDDDLGMVDMGFHQVGSKCHTTCETIAKLREQFGQKNYFPLGASESSELTPLG